MLSSLSRRRKSLAHWADRVSSLLGEPFSVKRLPPAYGFTMEMLRHPRSIGAVCPSGPQLAGRMAALVPSEGSGLIVEIGAGTGAVTEAMLQRGISSERLLILERSPAFCQLLRQKFPQLRVVQGDAAKLASYMTAEEKVDAIVSSVPLMSLPGKVRSDILLQIKTLLKPGGCVIQYTYVLWSPSPFRRVGYTCDRRSIVLRNVPPARLERFRVPARQAR